MCAEMIRQRGFADELFAEGAYDPENNGDPAGISAAGGRVGRLRTDFDQGAGTQRGGRGRAVQHLLRHRGGERPV